MVVLFTVAVCDTRSPPIWVSRASVSLLVISVSLKLAVGVGPRSVSRSIGGRPASQRNLIGAVGVTGVSP